MKGNWFETWFDSGYYELLYRHRDEEEARQFLEPLLKELQLPPGSKVLDAACGKGRHALTIAQKGFEVTGVDLSYKNIREAKKLETESLSFFRHDMKNLFRVNYFDLIVNLYTSFGYFDSQKEDEQTIRAFSRGLKRGGRLVIDFFNTAYTLKHLVEDESKTIENISFKISKDVKNGQLLKEIAVNDNGREKKYYEKVRCLQLDDFKSFFSKNKLTLVNVFGDYNLSLYEQNTSERLIMIAQK